MPKKWSGSDCGGCRGDGAHKRWCPAAVGPRAARIGSLSERADDLAEAVGAIDPVMANQLWTMAETLRRKARESKDEWFEQWQ